MSAKHISKKNIKFLGVSSGACAPFSRGKIGAEKGFKAIKEHYNKNISRLFDKKNTHEIVSLKQLADYIVEHEAEFFRDVAPRGMLIPSESNERLYFPNTLKNYFEKNRKSIIRNLKSKSKKKKDPLKALDKFIKDHREAVQKTDKIHEKPTTLFARNIQYLTKVCEIIRDNVHVTLTNKKFPFVIAGDHSTAAGTIAGIKKFIGDKKLGVIWVDAHVDAHSPYSTPSGNMHGMPLGVALGLGIIEGDPGPNLPDAEVVKDWRNLCSMHAINVETFEPMITKEQLVFIGIRSWEDQEEKLLQDGVKHFKMTREKEEGIEARKGEKYNHFNGENDRKHLRNYTLQAVCEKTIQHLKKEGCDYLYVSFDIDSIDGNIVPGTGTPVNYGLAVDEAKFILKQIWNNTEVPLISMEIVEINPTTDVDKKTIKVACEIIKSLVDNK